MEYSFIDLFAGIGGIRLGFEQAGFKCVFSSEWDRHASSTYEANFGDKPFGDITKIDAKDIPKFDILCAGFPCQPFSNAGKKLGFEDTRGTLFFEVIKIAKYHNPNIIFLENVKGLLSHDKGNTFKVIYNSILELGYKVSYAILNAKDFGIAQNRERIYIVASKDNFFDFNTLSMLYKKEINLNSFLLESNRTFLNKNDYTILDSFTKQKSGLIFVGYRNKNIRIKGVRENTNHLSRVHKQPNRIYSIDGVHPTIASQETAGRYFIYNPYIKEVFRLNIEDCYKLMGFPSDFKIHHSKTEAYKQIGNSVVVPVINIIAEEIKNQGMLYSEQCKKII